MMSPPLELWAGSALIPVSGSNLDGVQATALKPLLEAARAHYPGVVLDLRSVRSVAPSGWDFLLATQHQALAQGGDLKVCNLRTSVRLTFEMVGLHRLIACYPPQKRSLV